MVPAFIYCAFNSFLTRKFCFRLTPSSAAGTPKCLAVTVVHETLPLSSLQPPLPLRFPPSLLSSTQHPLPCPLPHPSPRAWEAMFQQEQTLCQLTSTSLASWHQTLPNRMKMPINNSHKIVNIVAVFTKWLTSQRRIRQWNETNVNSTDWETLW